MRLGTRRIVVAGSLGAVSIFLGITGIGRIFVPFTGIAITIMHIPVILGGIVEGPLVGALIGLIFGLFSFLAPSSALLADPLVSVLPRVLIGVVSYLVYVGIRRALPESVALIITGILGSLSNTVGVLGMATLRGYITLEAAAGIAVAHGLPEAAAAGLLMALLVPRLRHFVNRK